MQSTFPSLTRRKLCCTGLAAPFIATNSFQLVSEKLANKKERTHANVLPANATSVLLVSEYPAQAKTIEAQRILLQQEGIETTSLIVVEKDADPETIAERCLQRIAELKYTQQTRHIMLYLWVAVESPLCRLATRLPVSLVFARLCVPDDYVESPHLPTPAACRPGIEQTYYL